MAAIVEIKEKKTDNFLNLKNFAKKPMKEKKN